MILKLYTEKKRNNIHFTFTLLWLNHIFSKMEIFIIQKSKEGTQKHKNVVLIPL